MYMAEAQVLDRSGQSFLRNPYPHFQRFRETDPIQRLKPHNVWTFFRHDDVTRILKDDARTTVTHSGVRSMLNADPPEHTRLRSFAQRTFTLNTVRGLRPRVEKIVEDLLDSMQGERTVEAVSRYAYPLPMTVIAEMLGVEMEHREFFQDASRRVAIAMGHITDPKAAAEATHGRKELAKYFKGLIKKRRKRPQDDLISKLVVAQEETGELADKEMLDMLVLLLIAGHETMVNLIANGLLALLRNRDAFESLRRGEVSEERAVEEILRYDSPVQYTARITTAEIEIGGIVVPPRQPIRLCIASANHDESKFTDPETLDLNRDPNPHIAFGTGIHYCLGAQLARMEGRVAIAAMIRRFPNMRLADEELFYRPTTVLRGLEKLPILLD
jgi:cytochrome P450